MMHVQPYTLPDVVDREALREWQQTNAIDDRFVPTEVRQFINAVAAKLPDFQAIRMESTTYTGYELELAGMKEFKGQPVRRWDMYRVDVPFCLAVNNRNTMLRLYRKKGKQGLIDYCRARVKGTHLERLLYVLNVHVFRQESPEFNKVMTNLQQSPRIE